MGASPCHWVGLGLVVIGVGLLGRVLFILLRSINLCYIIPLITKGFVKCLEIRILTKNLTRSPRNSRAS